MSSLKNRFQNSLALIQGPYRILGVPQFRIQSRDLGLAEIQEGITTHGSNEIEMSVRYANDQLHFNVPEKSTFQRATFWGWETIWDGFQATFSSATQKPSSCMQISTPATGLWRVSTPFKYTEILVRYPEVCTPSKRIPLFQRFPFRSLAGALLGHGALVVLLLFLKSNPGLIFDQFFRQPESSSDSKPPTQIWVNPLQAEGAFQGRSLFAESKPAEAPVKKKESQEDVLRSKLQGLAQLSQSLRIAPSKNVPPSASHGQSENAQAFSDSNQRFQSKMNSSTEVSAAPQKINWVPQFSSGKSGPGSLNDAQQRQLMEAFGKLQDRFRGCYETALLKFDELAVTVNFQGTINSEGRIGNLQFKFSGRSTPESQDQMTECLKNLIGLIKVDRSSSGVIVKNQFIFKS